MKNTFTILRNDALAKGMTDLAIVYGWSILNIEAIEILKLVKGLK